MQKLPIALWSVGGWLAVAAGWVVLKGLDISLAWLSLGWWLGIAVMVADQRWWSAYWQGPTALTRSALFLAIFIPLYLFVVSSSSVLIGIGLVLGMGWLIAAEAWQLKNNVLGFHAHFLAGTRALWNEQTITIVVWAWTLLMIIGWLLAWQSR